MRTTTVIERPAGVNAAADLAIEALADENVDLRETRRQLIDLVSDLTYDNYVLKISYEREFLSRIHGDRTIERLQRLLARQRAA